MTKRLFGTDGLRGRVNEWPMTPEIALRLGLAAGRVFKATTAHSRIIIGKDTRLSGYVFETALTSGLCASGMDAFLVGPLPTPAISFLTRNMRAAAGVVISASHNPYYDNGIKFFDPMGMKLPDEAEDEIAEMVLRDGSEQWDYPDSETVGRAFRIQDASGRYIVALKNTFPNELTLDGLTIALDCANGAAYKVAPLVFEELGAKVVKFGCEPSGRNINEQCGSTYPERIAAKVREIGADIGIALDGDADRVIVVDEKGQVLDGDQIMALCAQDLMERGEMNGGTLVSTVMSNMALEIFMHERGGRLVRTKVGDRYVAEGMRREKAVLGGEQSGHIIFINFATTGDGILAALQLLRIMVAKQKPLSELSHLLEPFPQVLVNVEVGRKIPFEEAPEIAKAVLAAESRLGGKGRVLLRYSGTEPKARVMVEGENEELVRALASEIACACEKYLQ
ncbi:phosphoglucosamine mutase [Desulfovibrio sp. X2]|uniref:phosphoglucosamine mutase n=1 Tax=Desulfovibrio sp. X2 TaxID=941449 RepID=UPI000358B2B6|nr:phosphoglucosamine mutase [Desulfovibrio sp. X2]EPR42768.1 phosphoglucosamine mutase [Desulfovibrio sp. X2]